MQIKIEDTYSKEEIKEMLNILIRCNVLDKDDINLLDEIVKESYCFLTINYVLLPFFNRFTHYSLEGKLLFTLREYEKGLIFYKKILIDILNKVFPKLKYDYNVDVEDHNSYYKFYIIVNNLQENFEANCFDSFTKNCIVCINRLFQEYLIPEKVYLLDVDIYKVYLLLTEDHYKYLLEERVLYFSNIDYPEIEDWRKNYEPPF